MNNPIVDNTTPTTTSIKTDDNNVQSSTNSNNLEDNKTINKSETNTDNNKKDDGSNKKDVVKDNNKQINSMMKESLNPIILDFVKTRKVFLLQKNSKRLKDYVVDEETLKSRVTSFKLYDADNYKDTFQRTWNFLFPDRKTTLGPSRSMSGMGGNHYRPNQYMPGQEVLWDNPHHVNSGSGIFSNGDIRSQPSRENAVHATDYERQALSGYSPSFPQMQQKHQHQQDPRVQGVDDSGNKLLNWLTGGANQKSNNDNNNSNNNNNPQQQHQKQQTVLHSYGEEAVQNMFENTQNAVVNAQDNLMKDEALVLQAASGIEELRGNNLQAITTLVSENSQLHKKLIHKIDEISCELKSANSSNNPQNKGLSNDFVLFKLKEQYLMAIRQIETTIHQLDQQFQFQQGHLTRQMQEMCNGRNQEEMKQLSGHIHHFQAQLNYLSNNYKGQRQLLELQINIWKNLSEQEELLPFEIARNTVLHQLQIHQAYLRQQQAQQMQAQGQQQQQMQQQQQQQQQMPQQGGTQQQQQQAQMQAQMAQQAYIQQAQMAQAQQNSQPGMYNPRWEGGPTQQQQYQQPVYNPNMNIEKQQ